jgi:hypothetical protein
MPEVPRVVVPFWQHMPDGTPPILAAMTAVLALSPLCLSPLCRKAMTFPSINAHFPSDPLFLLDRGIGE